MCLWCRKCPRFSDGNVLVFVDGRCVASAWLQICSTDGISHPHPLKATRDALEAGEPGVEAPLPIFGTIARCD